MSEDQTDLSWRLLEFEKHPCYQKLQEYYNTPSFFEVIGKARDEMTHSAFLAWLLNPQSNHGLGYFPLEQLIKIYAQRGWEQKNDTDFKGLLMKKIIPSQIDIRTEEQISVITKELKEDGTGQGNESKSIRLDIDIQNVSIESKGIYDIIIENKVCSKEHDSQTEAYKNILTNTRKGRKFMFIFLVPSLECQCSSDSFVKITYQDILYYILEPVLDKNIDKKTKTFIEDYIKCLSKPCLNGVTTANNKKTSKKQIIMATSDEESNWLLELWDDNEELLMATLKKKIESLRKDPESDPELNKLEDIESVLANKKDNTKYKVSGIEDDSGKIKSRCEELSKKDIQPKGGSLFLQNEKGSLGKGALVLFVAVLVASQNQWKCKETKDALNKIERKIVREDIHNNDGTDQSGYQRAYKLVLDDGVLWINTQWSISNIQKFLKAVPEKLKFDITTSNV